MANEQNRSTFALGDVFHLADGFLLELGIANCEYLINHQNLWLQMSGYSET